MAFPTASLKRPHVPKQCSEHCSYKNINPAKAARTLEAIIVLEPEADVDSVGGTICVGMSSDLMQ